MMLIRVEAASLSAGILYRVNIKQAPALSSLVEYCNIAVVFFATFFF